MNHRNKRKTVQTIPLGKTIRASSELENELDVLKKPSRREGLK